MGILDRFSKKEPKKVDAQEIEEYIEDETSNKEPEIMETTFDKVDLSKLDEEEFEAYMRNPEIFAEEHPLKVDTETEDAAIEQDFDRDVQPSVPAKKGNPFGKMKVKFPNFKKEVPVTDLETEESDLEDSVSDSENDGQEEVEGIDLENLSLDDLEKLYDEDSEQLEDKQDIEDLTGVVSLRGVNKRFERLSEKEERRKAVEKAKKKAARRKLMNGTFTLVVFGGVFYFMYTAFEEPINTFASESFTTAKAKVSSVFNKDVQEQLAKSVEDAITKDEPVKLLSEYGDTFPKKVNVNKTPIKEFTIGKGNYVVGKQIPEGNYLIQGTVNKYASDLDLSQHATLSTDSYENNIVALTKGEIISLEGSMYPNAYRSTDIIKAENLSNGILYEVGRDIDKEAVIFVKGQGIVEYLDKNLELIEEEPINNTNTITVDEAEFVRFTGVNTFSSKK